MPPNLKNCGVAMELDLFQQVGGGSIPTTPLQFKVIQVDKAVAATAFKCWHYFGDKGFISSFTFAPIFEGEVWGAIAFGSPNAKSIKGVYRKESQHGVLEITRLAVRPEAPKNTCSRLIAISIKLLRRLYPLKTIVTYADTAQGHEGVIYKASGFEYLGLTAQKTDFIAPDGTNLGEKKLKGVKYSELDGEWVPRSRKHLFVKRFGGVSNAA